MGSDPLRKTIFFPEEEIRSVRKARDDKSPFVGVPTGWIEIRVGLNPRIHRFSWLITPVTPATKGTRGLHPPFALAPRFVGQPTNPSAS